METKTSCLIEEALQFKYTRYKIKAEEEMNQRREAKWLYISSYFNY
jgi:hypothetical protein